MEARDRFLMYTDGLVEPENARGEPFGDQQLEQVVRNNRSAASFRVDAATAFRSP